VKIGFFSDRYLPLTDGVAISIESFRLELEKRGHEVYIFAPKPTFGYKEPSKNIMRFPAVKGFFWDDHLTSFFFPPQVMRKIDQLDLDIIHFHTPAQISLFGAYYALKNDIPLVTTYHTDLYEYVKHYPAVLPGLIALSMLLPTVTGGGMAEYRESLSSIKPESNVDKWNQKIVERGMTLIHNKCDLVISPSAKIAAELKRWKTKARIEILPTGVDKITTTKNAIKQLKSTYHLQPEDQIVLSLGRVGPEKNIGLLVQAFEQVARQNPHAKLLIIGDGEDLERLKEQAAQTPYAGRIIFTGRIADRNSVGAAYELASVFVLPSLTDTQGLVLNEAAQAGVPLIIVDHGISEVVIDRQNGFITKPNPGKLAGAILTILKDSTLQHKMSVISQQLAANYTPVQQTTKLLGLYEETIRNHVKKTSPANR
jgi:1,2-diacylglycerol 3-alpha-glucosyltransferase